MAGRQRCRGNTSVTAGGALAAAAVGSAIAAGALGNMGTTKGATGSVVAEETQARTQHEAREDMPMCRHINPISTTVGCCSVEKQLWELSQILDYQNKILVELLQTMRGQ